MEIEILKTDGFEEAIEAMRLPLKSGDRSDSGQVFRPLSGSYFQIGEKDRELSEKLIAGGSSHRKHLRLIDAWIKVKAPLFWWKEFDTYRVGVDKLSESTMHTLMRKPIREEDFDLPRDEEGRIAFWIALFISELEDCRQAGNFEALNALLPQSYIQTRIIKVSYEALRSIYFERRYHVLPQWRAFCEALKELPESSWITD